MSVATGLIVLLGLLQASAGTFEIELWPGEGRPVFEATGQAVTLYEDAATSAKRKGQLTVQRGQSIAFDETRYRTVAAGRLRALLATQVSGRIVGPVGRMSRMEYYRGKFPPGTKSIAPGATLEFLQYRAEGTCFVRVDGDVIDSDPCPATDARAFQVEADPKVEWWIRVVSAGTPIGWVMVDDGVIGVVRREF